MPSAMNASDTVQTSDYYPFGMLWTHQPTGLTPTNNYLYNGKELQTDLGLDWADYGARMYDPALGRWHVVDPLIEDLISSSPYSYVLNNPVFLIDPTGMLPAYNWDTERYEDDEGKEVSWDDVQKAYGIGNANPAQPGSGGGYAILIGFPDATAEVNDSNQFLKAIFGDRGLKVHHAGIIIVDDQNLHGGKARAYYFDFGRFKGRKDMVRLPGYGVVRSSETIGSPLQITDIAINEDGTLNQEHLYKALRQIGGSSAISGPDHPGYDRLDATVVPDVNYESMLSFAREQEQRGNVYFGGYASNSSNRSYCAKFVRQVLNAGGENVIGAFTGGGNLRVAARRNHTTIYQVYRGVVTEVEPS